MVQAVLNLDLSLLEILSDNRYIKPYALLIKIHQFIKFMKEVLRQNIPALIQKFFKSLK